MEETSGDWGSKCVGKKLNGGNQFDVVRVLLTSRNDGRYVVGQCEVHSSSLLHHVLLTWLRIFRRESER